MKKAAKKKAARARTSNPGAPSLANLGTVSEHGRVHELQVERSDGQVESHTWSSARPLMLWSPQQRAIVFVHGATYTRPVRGEVPRDDGAAATYERFHNRRARATRELVVPATSLRELGRGVIVAYRDPPLWRGRVAEHKLGRAVRVWCGQSGNRKVYVVAGGRLRMTSRGIEG